MGCSLSTEQIAKTIEFHGHECPGLSIGLRAAELCLRELGHNDQSPLVAVSETDMCGADAIQFLTGCTYGKGNFIHRDHGKMAFSFHRRSDGKALRALLRPDAYGPAGVEMRELMKRIVDGTASEEEKRRSQELRAQVQKAIMDADLEILFSIEAIESLPPRPARILDSLACAHCGELTMESRTRRFGGETLCIPCFEQVEQKI
ncbi:FmdE family protein [Desulfocurvibacter africanus]|uniref:FmdE family protein n=1 Tax=Desulfocurvibacter africanus TaxID=873 RepID=UPI00041008A3|nr:FmdE family protein [Desulfocurvibacter africanus]